MAIEELLPQLWWMIEGTKHSWSTDRCHHVIVTGVTLFNGCISTHRGHSSFGWRSFSKCCQRQGIESTWHEREGWLCRLLLCLDVKCLMHSPGSISAQHHGHILTAMINLKYNVYICWVSCSLFIIYGSFLCCHAFWIHYYSMLTVSSFKMSGVPSRSCGVFVGQVKKFAPKIMEARKQVLMLPNGRIM